MSVIAFVENSLCLMKKEYLIIDDDEIIGSHSPEKATLFESKERALATLEAVFHRSEDVQYTEAIEDEYQAYRARLEGDMAYRRFKPLHPLSRPYIGEDKITVLQRACDIVFLQDSEVKYEHNKTWPQLSTLFEIIHNAIPITSRNDNDTSQAKTALSFTLFVKPDTTFSDFKAEWDLIIDKVTATNRDGHKLIDVFEHTLSEHGSITITVDEQQQQYTIGTQFSPARFTSLDDLFTYWQTQYYYD